MTDDLKRALAPMFLKNLSTVEPDKKGFMCGEDLRIYEGEKELTLRFLKGTPEKTRKMYRDKLTGGGIEFKVGKDYTN